MTITEAGFGADLGGEKFLDIKTRQLGKTPDAIVIVATLRALKMHGGVAKTALTGENVAAVTQGFANLKRHIKNMASYGASIVVAINQFASDTEAEIAELTRLVEAEGVAVSLTQVFEKGGAGGIDLAEKLTSIFTQEAKEFHYLYDLEASVENKITTVVTQIYGGKKVNFSAKAARQLKEIEENGWDKLPVCMAKTQYSFSDNPKLLAAPEGFEVTVRELVPKIGAGFIVALLGDVMTMPGLPKKPAALNMDIDETGKSQVCSKQRRMMVKSKLTPFITLNGKAKEAMTFYAQVLPDTKIIRMEFYHESPAFSELKEELVLLKGTELFFLDMQKEYAAPTPNWSNSLLLDCATEAEFDEIFAALSDQGSIMMGPEAVGDIRKCAWITDRFGLTWQPVWK